jgi:WxL domain surface cell wall-binding
LPRGHDARLLLIVVAAISSVFVAMLGWGSPRASAAALPSAVWTASKTVTSTIVTPVTAAYTYTVMAATTSTLSKVTMTVPAGTGGTPAVGTVTPASITAGKSVTLTGTLSAVLTYTFNPVTVAAGTVLSIQVTGLTNTTTPGTYTSTITTENGSTAVDAGTASFVFTLTALGAPGWSTTSTVVGVPNTSYTYAFTPSSLLSSVTLTITISVPPGTSGTPTIGSVSPNSLLGALNVPTLNASGTTLTITGTAVTLSLGTPVSIQINGLTNTRTAGTYVPEISTSVLGILADSAVAPAVTFPAVLALTTPATLTWSGALTGRSQALADTNAADEQLVVNDQTGSGDGWNVTVTASNFTNGGGHSLPSASVLEVTGSVTNAASAATPTASCVASSICTLPTDSVTYPQTITSAAQSPTPVVVYVADQNTGIGPVTIGGSTAANPFGWWVNVPGYAASGTYASTVTVSVGSGP